MITTMTEREVEVGASFIRVSIFCLHNIVGVFLNFMEKYITLFGPPNRLSNVSYLDFILRLILRLLITAQPITFILSIFLKVYITLLCFPRHAFRLPFRYTTLHLRIRLILPSAVFLISS